jgi:CubicO group peptidase (beta-lactamase class C family)
MNYPIQTSAVPDADVVDLFAGHADPARTRPWNRDTIVHLYSTTKGMTALCAHRLVERGALDLDAPVAHYWPAFAAAGKAAITVREAAEGEVPLVLLAFINPVGNGDHNSTEHRRAEIPAINGHGSAAALSRIYGALACGGEVEGARVLSPASIDRARSEQCAGVDPLLGAPMRMGLGFWLTQRYESRFAFGPNDGAFGHPGAGGSVGFADPSARLGFGYVTNRMGSDIAIDPRPQALIEAVYACNA